ncbi:unnamed protein product [Calicophoron daubneyi]|uniref:Uncharacterized protein n=1 Tax=Calicophoron daubneyi TaxID=300641 RepID=A0AAV2TAI3_CALDB
MGKNLSKSPVTTVQKYKSGMFWESYAAPSRINELLDKPDLTVEELLDDDDILQKCRERDGRLIQFLCRDENVDYLLHLVSDPPKATEFDKSLYRYPSLACEIMTCDIGELLDALVTTKRSGVSDPNGVEESKANKEEVPPADSKTSNDNALPSEPSSNDVHSTIASSPSGVVSPREVADKQSASEAVVTGDNQSSAATSPPPSVSDSRPRLDCLLNAFDTDQSINPLSASFISRLLVHLAVQRGQIVIPYMRHHPDFLRNVLSRFDVTAMADLLLHLAQQERGSQQCVFEWYIEDRLVPRLIESFSTSKSWEVHESSAHCLVQLISILRSYLVNNAHFGPDSDSSTAIDSGLPSNSPYAMLMNEDEATYNTATKLLDILESEETATSLLEALKDAEHVPTSVVVSCIDVFTALLDKRRPETGFSVPDANGGTDFELLLGGGMFGAANPSSTSGAFGTFPAGFGGDSGHGGGKSDTVEKIRVARASANVAKACLPRISDLHALLRRPGDQRYTQMPTTAGVLDPPLGPCRLNIAQFLAMLASLPQETGIQKALVKDGVVETLLGLFEKYSLNTLLHQAVRDFLQCLLGQAKTIRTGRTTSDTKSSRPTTNSDKPDEGKAKETSAEKPGTTGVQVNGKSSADNESCKDSEKPISTDLDEAISWLFQKIRITDWCLRLSPLPKDRSELENSSVAIAHLSKVHPKPGYSGHLWQLANLIEEARHGPREDFTKQIFEALPQPSVDAWNAFVSGDLGTLNSIQVADDMSGVKDEPDEGFLQMMTHQNLGRLFSQSAMFFDITSGGLGSGKFSLFLAPRNSSDDQIKGISMDNPSVDSLTSGLGGSFSTSMWTDADDTKLPASGGEGSSSPTLKTGAVGLVRPGFSRPRIASLSSDDDSDEEGGEEEDEDQAETHEVDEEDEADDEEDLKSPVFIKQQRSAVNQPSTIIPLSVTVPKPQNVPEFGKLQVSERLSDFGDPCWASFPDSSANESSGAKNGVPSETDKLPSSNSAVKPS